MQETQEMWIRSLGWEDPLEEEAAHSSILVRNSMDRGAWQAIVHGVSKSWTQLSNIIAIQQWGLDVTPAIQHTHTHTNMYKGRQRRSCDEQLQMGCSC